VNPDNIAATAFRVAEQLATQPVLHLCDDDQQAEALAGAVAALASDEAVVFLPYRG
jgi:transcription-repair coupling factor (superfamily II helicase)